MDLQEVLQALNELDRQDRAGELTYDALMAQIIGIIVEIEEEIGRDN